MNFHSQTQVEDWQKWVGEARQNGKVVLPFPVSGLIPRVVGGFLDLLRQKEEYRISWEFDLQGNGDPDDGLVQRNPKKQSFGQSLVYDDKFFFHYRPGLHAHLNMRGVSFQRYKDWLGHCDDLYQECRATALFFLSELDRQLPGFNFVQSALGADVRHVLRILYYNDVRPDAHGVIGKAHEDKALLTLHVADLRPGLRIGDPPQVYTALPDTALAFFGKKVRTFPGCELTALPHDVVLTGDHKPDDPKRWSVIFFLHSDLVY